MFFFIKNKIRRFFLKFLEDSILKNFFPINTRWLILKKKKKKKIHSI
jgi:hypothetical protein